MAVVFNQVPDWQSFENQGGNIAVADLGGNGANSLLVLRIDHPVPGPNRAFYRVGRNLDAQGGVVNWGGWLEIPQWESNDNQHGGLAIANFGGANGRALVVFQVQHVVPGPNVGRFRIGRNLAADGTVTGGWADWKTVPNWTSWSDQGAAIAVADLDGNGQPDLVVFHIDDFHTNNPTRPNKGFYKVGKNLTNAGGIQSWSDWIEVDWFSWFNQGAGVAITDLDANGRPEIIVFQVDAPPDGENVGWFRVGWNLDNAGVVRDGWGPWVRFDGWGSFENQGGGIALVQLGGNRPKAAVFQVDNPVGLNRGLFAVTDLALDIDTAATKGVWRLLPYLSEVLPVHAALLHTGKVLFFAGSGNSAFRFQPGFLGNEALGIFTSVVWDPASNVLQPGTFQHVPTLRRVNGSVVDFFCCGHTFLSDGRILAAGGSGQYDKIIVNGRMENAGHGFAGIRDVLIFDADTVTWTPVDPMAHGRWYPTVIRLADGTIIVASGLDERAQGQDNNTIERNTDQAPGGWIKTCDFNLPLYPHLFQLRDGQSSSPAARWIPRATPCRSCSTPSIPPMR